VQNCYICGFNRDILRLTDYIVNSLGHRPSMI